MQASKSSCSEYLFYVRGDTQDKARTHAQNSVRLLQDWCQTCVLRKTYTWHRLLLVGCLDQKLEVAIAFEYEVNFLSCELIIWGCKVSGVFHNCNFSTKRIVYTLTCPSGAYISKPVPSKHLKACLAPALVAVFDWGDPPENSISSVFDRRGPPWHSVRYGFWNQV